MKEKDIAYIDDLSELANRRAFKDTLEKDLSKPEEKIKGLHLALTDLDHFKKINDAYGHLSGDYMIKEFSKILTEGVKGGDNLVARYGGDEFIIILRKINTEEVLNTCDRIRENLSKKEFLLPEVNKKIKVTMSIGIAEYPTDGKTPDGLFAKADEALYSSKRLGRNRTSLAKDVLAQVKEEKRIQDALLKPSFIGREKELAEVGNSLFGERPHKLLIISGDTGSGKTRMLEETAALSESKNQEAFLITCTEIEKSKPYSLIVDIIDAVSYKHYDVCKKAFDSLNKKHKSVLSVVPKLKKLTAASKEAFKWDPDTRLDLFNGLTELFLHIIEYIKPLLLVDNIDWIDEASIEIINYLIVSQKQAPLLICGADSRPNIAKVKRKASFLDELLDEISEFEIVPRINLEPLTESQTKELIKTIFAGTDVPEPFLDNMYQATKGNPFFATELLRDFLARRIVYLKHPEWIFNAKKEDFPKDLKELLEKKFENLDPEEKELLLVAAGIGRSFKFDFMSKLKNINRGYVQDIMAKAADRNIFSSEEVGLGEAVSFNNEMTRALLYESLDEKTRKQLHLDIATVMEQEYKADIESVSTELAFHFDRAKLQSKASEYTEVATKYVDKLFQDKETEKLIEKAIEEREEKDKQEPIKKEAWPFVVEMISAFNGAVRAMRFYQRPNEITEKTIKRLIPAFEGFFKIQDNITLSCPEGESKDSFKLLINGRELHVASSVEEVFSKNLIGIMRDSHIGSITFRCTITKKEIEAFIAALEKPMLYGETKRSWEQILSDKKITGIKIDEVLYKRVLSEEEKRQHRREFIKDFAATEAVLAEAAAAVKRPAVPAPTAEPVAVDKRIRKVTEEEKNILAKTIAKLPNDVIAETIANEYVNRKKSILDIKDMLSVCFKNMQQKEVLLPLLQNRLEKLGMSKECFEWLIDETDFLKHPVRKRANIYINTDPKTVLEMGVLENLKPTLEELFTLQEDDVAKEIMDKYLQSFKSTTVGFRDFRVYAAVTFADIIKTLPPRIDKSYVRKIADTFLDALKAEKDPTVYDSLVENTQFLVYKLLEFTDYEEIANLLSAVRKDTKEAAGFEWGKQFAEKALEDIDAATLNKELIEVLKEEAFDRQKSELILNIFKMLGASSVPYLLDLLLIKVSDYMPLEWYQQERQIIEILKEFKETTVEKIEKMLDSKEQKKIDLALEILMHFSDEKLMYLYRKALVSTNRDVRMHSMKALVELDTAEALGLIKDLFVQESSDVQRYIIATMGVYSRNNIALEFLSQIKGHEQEVNEAIKKIKKRTG